jgi:hypothetical protein
MVINPAAHHYGLKFAPHTRGREYLMQVADPLSGTNIMIVNLDTHHSISEVYRLTLPILALLETAVLCSVPPASWWN